MEIVENESSAPSRRTCTPGSGSTRLAASVISRGESSTRARETKPPAWRPRTSTSCPSRSPSSGASLRLAAASPGAEPRAGTEAPSGARRVSRAASSSARAIEGAAPSAKNNDAARSDVARPRRAACADIRHTDIGGGWAGIRPLYHDVRANGLEPCSLYVRSHEETAVPSIALATRTRQARPCTRRRRREDDFQKAS